MNINEVIATLATERLGRDGPPERPRQRLASRRNDVVPIVHPHRRNRRGRQRPDPGAAALRAERCERKAGEFADGRQVGPDAPDGRDAGDARAGVRRLRRAGRATASSGSSRRSRGWPSFRSAARPSAPASTPRPASRPRSSSELAAATGLPLTEARDHFEAQGARDGLVETSGQLRTIAVWLYKIANDLRWMGSGPRTGLAEISLPDLQPGSSIMPGKVNPVIPEAVCMVVRAGRSATTQRSPSAARPGNFELNVMLPVHGAQRAGVDPAARQRHAAARRPHASTASTANVERCREYAESSPSVVTPLNQYIGYEERGQGGQAGARRAQDDPRGRHRARATSTAAISPWSSSTRRSTCCA